MLRTVHSVALWGAIVLASPTFAAAEAPPLWREVEIGESEPELERLSRATARLAAKVQQAVVQIRAAAKPASTHDGSERPRTSRGSGFIINPAGYVLTAHHVIEGAQEIEVRLATRRRLRARVLASEPQIDVALLKIDAGEALPVLPLGDSSKLEVGELVASVAYPFGRESSLSLGIVSRRPRLQGAPFSFDFIQTDASASAGSSGGPLVDARGRAVGMITMASQSGNAGFAVPISVIKNVLPRLFAGGKIAWGWLGVKVSELTLEMAETLGVSPARGVLISSVLPGEPAEKAEILPRDVVLAVNGAEVDSPGEFTRMVAGAEAGTEIQLTILRNGQLLLRSVRLGPKPEASGG